MILSVYDSILHLKKLENENKMTDDKWENIKSIIFCRLMYHTSEFNNSNIGIRTILIHSDFCLFELFNRKPEHKYLFIVQKTSDNIFPIVCTDKNKNVLKIYF